MTQDKTTLARRFYELTENCRLDEAVGLASDDFSGHGFGEGGRDGLRQDLETLRATFPDVHFDIRETVTDGDRIAVHMTLRGTHQGDFAGVPASGRSVEVPSTDIWRIENGRLAECWTVCDRGVLLMQIGAISPPAPPEPATVEAQAEAFVGRLFESAVSAWELLTAHVGLQLGLYSALRERAGRADRLCVG